jgi:uncharacterized protein (DUF2461 family)
MPAQPPVFTAETVKFFRDLSRHNSKDWMNANRARYAAHVTTPFRALLGRLAPATLKIHPAFASE